MKHTHHYVITAFATPTLIGSGVAIMEFGNWFMGLIAVIAGILLALSTIKLIKAGVFKGDNPNQYW